MTTLPTPGPADLPVKRRIVFVVGSGRSGTSTMAGALRTLGMHVPQPEVVADDTNPKGFGEPQWVVDFHDELLGRCNVQVSDARPSAWYETAKLSAFDPLRTRLATWLETQFDPANAVAGGPQGAELVVKDPRLAWFIGLWRSAAVRCDATPSYVTMLRPVTEVVGSKQRYYAAKFGEVQRTAAWVNMMLHTERSTRGSQRRFVRYADMLDDWTIPVFGIGEDFDLAAVLSAQANDIRAVHGFIDPSLRRVQLTWDDVEVPAKLREIAQETWEHLDRLADPDGDQPGVHDVLDELRGAYVTLYEEAEALSSSTALAAHREGRAVTAEGGPQPARPGAPRPTSGAGTPRTPGTPSAEGARRGVERVPHQVRALVPASARRGLRKALGRERD